MSIFKKTPQKNNDTDKRDPSVSVSRDLDENISRIKRDFGESPDVVINYIELNKSVRCANVYIKEMADGNTINSLSLELANVQRECGNVKSDEYFDVLKNILCGLRASKQGSDFGMVYNELLAGNTVFLIDGSDGFLSVATNSTEGRSIDEPTSQTILKGPKDAFTENIDKNVYMIRKRIRNEALRVENLTVGTVTHTDIKLMYINGIAKNEIVQELRDRIGRINNDSIPESGYIEEFIKTDRYSIFPTSLNSEKPDSVAAALLEGRVAILVDGTPYVLTAPALFVEFIHASEDYYHHFAISSFMRILRYSALLLTLLVPALYVAITTFHQEIIPTPLLISIAAQREGEPFPAFLEVLIMEITFEILREAGIRMPRAIGPAISIVGALVLGQAAVEAGLISAAVVIVVSITAISSFAITNYGVSNAIRLIRFVLIFMAGILGLYGISMGVMVMTLHLCKMKSVTVPYLTPMAPRIKGGNKDSLFRFPLWKMEARPAGISASGNPRTDDRNTASPGQKEAQELK